MESNSIDDLNVLTEYQKLEKIQRIEEKMRKLSFTPLTSCVALIFYSFCLVWGGYNTWSASIIVPIAILIGSVGYSNVQRTDLLKQLFELKYSK